MLSGFKAGDRLSESQAKEILKAYGIPATRQFPAKSPEEAVQRALTLGFPVALKIDSPDIPHKTEAGGVVLDIDSPEKVREAFNSVTAGARKYKPDARVNGVLVQEMLEKGTEVITGISRDASFGPVIMFGLGGIFVEALEDVSLRVAPLNEGDAREMVREIKGHKVLSGARGNPPADEEAVVDILLKLSELATDFPQIAELDLNPLLVYEKGRGACAADALIIID
ncbi:MAG: acetate--CoA ligase family protein [Firmicutes bacterium]|nr:acetate--CoA ligase family protein [Bacillota bacterium]